MKKTGSRLVMGTALTVAAVAVALDHTRHRLPKAQTKVTSEQVPTEGGVDESMIVIEEDGQASPCSLGQSPCSLGNDE